MRRGLSIAILVTLCWFGFCHADNGSRLSLKKDVEVEHEQITMRDLVPESYIGNSHLGSLLGVTLGRAPLPGEVRSLERDYLLMRLRQAGCELDLAQINIPHKITVKRATFEVTPDYLEHIVRAKLFPRLPWDKDSIMIKSIKADRDLVLPRGEMEIEVGSLRPGRSAGMVNTALVFRVNKTYEKRLWLSLVLEVPGEVVVASRPLKRNQILGEDDVVIARVNLLDAPAGFVRKPESLIGKRLRRSVPAQRPLSINDVEISEAVKKGEIVTVLAESETIRIKGLGTARQSGRIGDWIKVANLDSGKEISARVVEAGVVAVGF